MLIIYVWLSCVTALLVLLAYQQYSDHGSLGSLFDITTIMRTRHDHQHDHLMKLESKVQDITDDLCSRKIDLDNQHARIKVLEAKRTKSKLKKD